MSHDQPAKGVVGAPLPPPRLPRVLIDARAVGPVPHGFGRYIIRLAEGLREVRSKEDLPYEPVFILGEEGGPEEITEFFPFVRSWVPFLSPAELIELPRLLKAGEASLYHSPTFSSLLRSPCPWVQTVHDLNHLSYGGWRQRQYYRFILNRFARNASRLLTVSEFSRDELARWLPAKPENIEVCYNALDPFFSVALPEGEVDRVLRKHGLVRGQYFFSLSNPKPHKNLGALLEAYREFRREQATATSGMSPWPLVLTVRESPNEEGVLALGGVGDVEARALLEAAGALVFPSLYEGFGLPPVEAAAVGTRIVVSDIPPHREGLADLGADEAIWVEPANVLGWAQAFAIVQRGGLAAPSRATRAKVLDRFSIIRMGRHMDRLYRAVLREEGVVLK